MKSHRNRRSLFSQRLDRIAFMAYLLGAIVPLTALAVVAQRHELVGEQAEDLWEFLLVHVPWAPLFRAGWSLAPRALTLLRRVPNFPKWGRRPFSFFRFLAPVCFGVLRSARSEFSR